MKRAYRYLMAIICMAFACIDQAQAQGVKIYHRYDGIPTIFYANEIDSIKTFDEERYADIDTSVANQLTLTITEENCTTTYVAKFADGKCTSCSYTAISTEEGKEEREVEYLAPNGENYINVKGASYETIMQCFEQLRKEALGIYDDDNDDDDDSNYTFGLDTSDPNRLVLTCYEDGVVYAVYEATFRDGMCISYILTCYYSDGEVDVTDMSDIYSSFSYNSILYYFRSMAGEDYGIIYATRHKMKAKQEKPAEKGQVLRRQAAGKN